MGKAYLDLTRTYEDEDLNKLVAKLRTMEPAAIIDDASPVVGLFLMLSLITTFFFGLMGVATSDPIASIVSLVSGIISLPLALTFRHQWMSNDYQYSSIYADQLTLDHVNYKHTCIEKMSDLPDKFHVPIKMLMDRGNKHKREKQYIEQKKKNQSLRHQRSLKKLGITPSV